MAKRSSRPEKRPPADPAQAAFRAVHSLTDGQTDEDKRHEAAKLLGSLGGAVDGHARAKALSKARRAEIAREGAKARWKGHKKGPEQG